MAIDLLLKILMKWSIQNQEYYMAYVLFTEFNVGVPVKLLYEINSRKIVTMTSLHDDSKTIIDRDMLVFMECLKRSKYTRIDGLGYGYVGSWAS